MRRTWILGMATTVALALLAWGLAGASATAHHGPAQNPPTETGTATVSAPETPSATAVPVGCGQMNAGASPSSGAASRAPTGVPVLSTSAAVPPTPTACRTATATATALPTGCGQLNTVPSPNSGPSGNQLNGVSALSSADVWAVGARANGSYDQTLVEHWDGTAWAVVPSPNVPGSGNNFLAGVSALASNDVWAVGFYDTNGSATDRTLVEHWNGSLWSIVVSANPGDALNYLGGVAALASNDVWAVGDYDNGTAFQTLVEHWDGTAWSVVPSPSPGTGNDYLTGVSALGSNDVWADGDDYNGASYQTLAEHWNGAAWSVVPSPSPGSVNSALSGVSALSSSDVWAVGYYSGSVYHTLVEHWNGTVWSVVPSPGPGSANNALNGVSALASNDVWAVGYYHNLDNMQTLVEHWDGTAWSVVPSSNVGSGGNLLNGVSGRPGGDVWAVGYYGGPQRTLVEKYGGPCVTPTPAPTASSTASPSACTAGVFSDVHPSDYFYTPVSYLASHGIISGYSDCTFRPYNNTTRSQMVKIVVLGFNKPIRTPGGFNYSFTDVPRTNPFFPVVETAYADGMVSGYTCGVAPAGPCDSLYRPYFLPYAYVTRGQLSKIDVIAAGWALYNPVTPTFTDVGRNSPFYQVIETAVCHGVISGYSDHTFRPFNDAARGQISKIVYLSIVNPLVTCGP